MGAWSPGLKAKLARCGGEAMPHPAPQQSFQPASCWRMDSNPPSYRAAEGNFHPSPLSCTFISQCTTSNLQV